MGCRKKKEKSHGPAIIILFWFFSPSHSLIPLMKSGQAEACSRRQQFHCTICASHIGWQGGEGSVGSTARRKERGRKITRHEIQNGLQSGHTDTPWCFVCSICLFSFSRVPILHLPLQKRTEWNMSQMTPELFWNINTSGGKQMSQVLTQKEPGTHTKWW